MSAPDSFVQEWQRQRDQRADALFEQAHKMLGAKFVDSGVTVTFTEKSPHWPNALRCVPTSTVLLAAPHDEHCIRLTRLRESRWQVNYDNAETEVSESHIYARWDNLECGCWRCKPAQAGR